MFTIILIGGNTISSYNKLKQYIPLVEFLGIALGKNHEIVLHDMTNFENSIITIKNGHVSNREVGGSLTTDLALKVMQKNPFKNDFLINYSGKTKSGELLHSSSFLIRNENGDIIGALCMNINVHKTKEQRKNLINKFTNELFELESIFNQIELNEDLPKELATENIYISIEDLATSLIMEELSKFNVPPNRMSSIEKMQIVNNLSKKGFFLIKGGINQVSEHLMTSKATIYRYLNEINLDNK